MLQDLVQLIVRGTQDKQSVEEAHALNFEQIYIIRFAEQKTIKELIDIALNLSNWLHDGEIGRRDVGYREITTKKLKLWTDGNRFPPKNI
jgi:hypothetical protein